MFVGDAEQGQLKHWKGLFNRGVDTSNEGFTAESSRDTSRDDNVGSLDVFSGDDELAVFLIDAFEQAGFDGSAGWLSVFRVHNLADFPFASNTFFLVGIDSEDKRVFSTDTVDSGFGFRREFSLDVEFVLTNEVTFVELLGVVTIAFGATRFPNAFPFVFQQQ